MIRPAIKAPIARDIPSKWHIQQVPRINKITNRVRCSLLPSLAIRASVFGMINRASRNMATIAVNDFC